MFLIHKEVTLPCKYSYNSWSVIAALITKHPLSINMCYAYAPLNFLVSSIAYVQACHWFTYSMMFYTVRESIYHIAVLVICCGEENFHKFHESAAIGENFTLIVFTESIYQ